MFYHRPIAGFEHGTTVRDPALRGDVGKIKSDDVDPERRNRARERDDEAAALAGSGAVRKNQAGCGTSHVSRIDERVDRARLQRNMKLT